MSKIMHNHKKQSDPKTIVWVLIFFYFLAGFIIDLLFYGLSFDSDLQKSEAIAPFLKFYNQHSIPLFTIFFGFSALISWWISLKRLDWLMKLGLKFKLEYNVPTWLFPYANGYPIKVYESPLCNCYSWGNKDNGSIAISSSMLELMPEEFVKIAVEREAYQLEVGYSGAIAMLSTFAILTYAWAKIVLEATRGMSAREKKGPLVLIEAISIIAVFVLPMISLFYLQKLYKESEYGADAYIAEKYGSQKLEEALLAVEEANKNAVANFGLWAMLGEYIRGNNYFYIKTRPFSFGLMADQKRRLKKLKA